MLQWQFVNRTTNEIQNQAAFLTVACYSKHFNTLIPTLVQSKSLSCGFATSQLPETDVNVAIRPQKIISSILVLIPVINKKMWRVNCVCPFISFAQWTQWRTVITHRLFFHSFYWLKTYRILTVVFKSVQFLFFTKFYVQSPGKRERFKQVHRHSWILD